MSNPMTLDPYSPVSATGPTTATTPAAATSVPTTGLTVTIPAGATAAGATAPTWTIPDGSISPNVYPYYPQGYWYYQYPAYRQTPHKCPVCDGKGTVASDFYDKPLSAAGLFYEDSDHPTCRSCTSGVIWR